MVNQKIKRNELYAGVVKLKISMPFLNSIKASWVRRTTDQNNKGLWKLFYEQMLNENEGKP